MSETPVSAQKVVVFCDKILISIRCLEQDIASLRVEVEVMKRAAESVITRAKATQAQGITLSMSRIEDLVGRVNALADAMTQRLAEHQAARRLAEKEIERLRAEVRRLREALKSYEQWEADLIMCNEAWRDRTLPRIPQDLWDRLLEIQAMRNRALENDDAKS